MGLTACLVPIAAFGFAWLASRSQNTCTPWVTAAVVGTTAIICGAVVGTTAVICETISAVEVAKASG
jgi:hypothetical protein